MNVYLGLGTNLGDKLDNLEQAVVALSKTCGIVITVSSIYESPAWGFESEDSFYNSVVLIETTLLPEMLLEACKEVEQNLGRLKKTIFGYESRIIDIDILLYNNLVLNTTNLTIPHPLIGERMFVLAPLIEMLAMSEADLCDFYRNQLMICNDKSVLKIVKS